MTKLILSIVAVSYLLGSIPFGYLLVRIFRGQDVRETGSGNIGATNVARTGSKGLAIATLLLDALKGYGAVAFAFWLARSWRWEGGSPADQASQTIDSRTVFLLAALAAFCAILGHVFTVWLRFKGGKGVATAVGAFAALAPRAIVVALVLFVIVVALTRYISLGSTVAAAAFPAVRVVARSGGKHHRPDPAADRGFVRADCRSAQRQYPPAVGRHRESLAMKENYE